MTTVGEVVDFKHFLPRMLELMLSQAGGIGPETVCEKLRYGQWRKWADSEQEAIHAFLWACWKDTLARFPAAHGPEVWLCAIAQVQDDIAPFLEFWRSMQTPGSIRHLASVLGEGWEVFILSSAGGSPWGEGLVRQFEQLRLWVLSPQTDATLEDAYFRYADEPFADEIARAVQHLGWIREASVGEEE